MFCPVLQVLEALDNASEQAMRRRVKLQQEKTMLDTLGGGSIVVELQASPAAMA
jgi:hypothetical protein